MHRPYTGIISAIINIKVFVCWQILWGMWERNKLARFAILSTDYFPNSFFSFMCPLF